MQPDVDLVYHSQDNSFGSIFGEGWSISIPYIERLNKSGVDQLYSTSTLNYFTSSIDGELVSTTTVSSTGSSYVARTENGAFDKYTFSSSTDSWTMTDKNGTQYAFGSTSDSQQSNPSNASDTYRWMLKQITDTNNNNVIYNYFKDSGQIYPSSTIYTGNGSSTGIFEVDFLRASRSDAVTVWQAGFGVSSNYLVNEIDVKVNGSWVRKYTLTYAAGNNGETSLLQSITESGQNGQGTVVSLPTSTFSYQVQPDGWTNNSSTWNPPQTFSALGYDNGVQVADVNGDGLPDILYGAIDSGGTHYGAYINTGNGWVSSSTWDPPVAFSNYGGDNGVRIADVNGDGLPDILYGYEDSSGVAHYGAWINTGSGWVSSSTWDPPAVFSDNGSDTGLRIADVNGDGLPDLIYGYENSSYIPSYAAWINTGSGWASDSAWDPPQAFSYAGSDTGLRIADVNGDGLPDLIYGYENISYVPSYAAYINTGNGWVSSSTWDPPTAFSYNGSDTGLRIGDVNGDGLPDLMYSYLDSSQVGHYAGYLNTGGGWVSSSTMEPPQIFSNDGYDYGLRPTDVNGDGSLDMLWGYLDTNGVSHYGAWTNNNTVRADLLTGMTYPQGGNSTIQYESATQFMAASTTLNPIPYPVYVVSQINQNNGSQNVSTSTYQYSGGTYYYGSPSDHEFAGFGTVTETDPAGNVTKTYYDTSNGVSSSTGQYQDNFWKIGKPYRVETYDNASHLYKVTITKWDDASLGGNAAYVFPDQTLTMDYEGSSSHDDSAESFAWNSANGNKTQDIQWGQVTGSGTGAFTTSTNGYVTNYTYASSTTSNVIDKVNDEILYNPSSTTIQESQYYYDYLGWTNVSKGNLTLEQDWISGGNYAAKQNTVNSYGLVTATLDPRNNTTTFTYDSYNLYPATTTNPLGQTTNDQYDYSTGKTTQVTDPNGDVTQTVYDGLGRPLALLQPNPSNPTTLVTSTAYVYTDTTDAVSVHESDYLNATTTVDTYSYYDGLNRLVQTRKSSQTSGTYKVTDTSYNDLGLTYQQSLPYFSSGSGKTTATSTSSLFATYSYNPDHEISGITTAVTSRSNTYNPWQVVTSGPDDQRTIDYDAFGNIIEVDETIVTSTYKTYYTYDGLHDLTGMTDAAGNVRNFTYDGLGRRLTAQDLHASGASTYGTWNYTYDNAGNLTQQVDPKNQTTTYAYDDINRPTSESFGGQTQISYTYDTCTQGIGRLCTASSSGAVVNETYNALGQLTQDARTIASTTYTTSYTYDWQGNQLTITSPDNSSVEYSYNTAGLPQTVAYEPSGGSYANVINSFTYSPTDQSANMTYANGVSVTSTYDPTQLYWLTQKLTGLPSGGGNAQNTSYTYNGNGDITKIVDTSISGDGRTVGYSYDAFGRLLNASTTNVSTTPSYNQIFTYDGLGNILTGPAGTYTYGATTSSPYADPDAVTSITPPAVTTPIIFDASSTYIPSTATTTFTWSHTVTSTANTVLVLGVLEMTGVPGATQTSTGASYDGVAMTKAADVTDTTSTRITIWYLLNPPSGTHTISSTLAVAGANEVFAAESFAGVSGIGVTSTAYSASNVASSTVTITSTNKNVIADFESNNDGSNAPTAASGQTQVYSGSTSGNVRSGGMGYIMATSSSPMANHWTYSTAAPFVAADLELVAATSSPATTTALTYDNDGNLLSYNGTTNTWNYRNQLAQSFTSGATSTYAYDYLGNRVELAAGSTTTVYPTQFYNTTSNGVASTSLKSIFANGALVATVQNSLAATFDASSSFNPTVASTTLTFPLTVTSTPNRVLLVGVTAMGASNTSTAATYNGTSMSLLMNNGNVNTRMQLWYLKNPASGTHNVSVTITTASANVIPVAVDFANASGVGATSSVLGVGTTTAVSISSQGGNIVADFLNVLDGTAPNPVPTSGQTLLVATTTSGAVRQGTVSYTNVTNSGPLTEMYAVSTSSFWQQYEVEIVATTSPAVYDVLNDNLGGANVIVNPSGTIAETLDYYPYGQIRVNTSNGGEYPGEQRKFIGRQYDPATQLSYLNARYYDGSRGQFISEDPVFLGVGLASSTQNMEQQEQEVQVPSLDPTRNQFLGIIANPMQLNAYEYSEDNPIIKTDPSGKSSYELLIPAAGYVVGDLSLYGANVATNLAAGNPWYENHSPASDYKDVGIEGAAAAMGAEVGPYVAGGAFFMTSAIIKYINKTNPFSKDNFLNTAVTVATEDIIERAPQVSGPLPEALSNSFFEGSHAIYQYTTNAISLGIDYSATALQDIYHDLQHTPSNGK